MMISFTTILLSLILLVLVICKDRFPVGMVKVMND